ISRPHRYLANAMQKRRPKARWRNSHARKIEGGSKVEVTVEMGAFEGKIIYVHPIKRGAGDETSCTPFYWVDVSTVMPCVLFTGRVKLPISTSGASRRRMLINVRIPRALPIESRAGMRGSNTSGSILRLRNWMSRRPVSFTKES